MTAAATAFALALISAQYSAPSGDGPSPSWHRLNAGLGMDRGYIATYLLERRVLRCKRRECVGATVTASSVGDWEVAMIPPQGGVKCRMQVRFAGLCVSLSGCGPRWDGLACQ